MHLMQHRGRAARRWFGPIILIPMFGLGGCYLPVEEGQNIADEYEEWAGFCGFLQNCGSDSEREDSGRSSNRSSLTSEPPADPPPSSDPPPESGSPSDPEPPTDPD